MATFFNAEEVDAQLEREFVEEVVDSMSMVEVLLENLRSNSVSIADSLATLKRTSHSLLLLCRSSNMPLMQIIAHRFDEYLVNLHDLSPANVADIQHFADKIAAIVRGELTESALEGGARLVRELPPKKTFAADIDFEVVIPKNVEVMAVLPERSMAHIVERELAACGLRSTAVRSPFEAFEHAVRIRPDLIISSMELGPLSGVDLACAFAAMPRTRNIPFALFTSYKWGHPLLESLPPRAALLRKGPSFGEDLAEALARFSIT
ncbi:MAG: response regulator [Alphaproteobacteria bacterium]